MDYIRIIIIAGLLLCRSALTSYAASEEDSLRKELRSRKADTVQAKIYHQLAVLTKYSDPQQSRAYAYAMLQLSEKLRYDKGQYGACRMLGELATIIGRKLDSAAYWYVSSLDFAARIKGNEQLLSLQETYNSLGGLYTDKGDFVAAIRYLNKADSIQPSPAEPSLNYDICNNYAFLYLDMGDVEKSLNKNREALRLAQSMPDEGSIANSCFNIGSCYRNAGLTQYNEGKSFRAELDSAIKYLHLSQAYFSANKHIYGLRAVHSELGNVYTALKDYDKAIAYCKENIVFNTQLKDTISLFETYCQIAQVYAYLKKRDSALTYLAKANTSGLQKVPKFQQSILYHTSIIYEKLGAYEQALLYYKQYKHFSDSLLAVEKEKQVSEIQTKYETSKKEKIINDQKLSLTRRQTMLTVFGAAIVLLSLLALFAILRFRLKQKAAAELAVKNERIETLIRELQHRVKNNMQLISSLLSLQGSSLQDTKARAAVQEGQMRIEAMSLIHRKLYLKNDISEVNIRDYLETLVQNLVAAYRPHPDQVRLVLESDNINLAVDTAVPLGLITNELVTNALKYGMSAPEPLLTVRLRLSREGLCKLTVADNGLGAHTPDAASGGLGMKLVTVLAAQIHASVSIRNEAGLIVDITQSSL